MNKLQFKTLRSQFRKLERDCFAEARRVEYTTGKSAVSVVANILTQKEREFTEKHGIDLYPFRKPNARNRVVSLKVVRKLDWPNWAFEEIKWN